MIDQFSFVCMWPKRERWVKESENKCTNYKEGDIEEQNIKIKERKLISTVNKEENKNKRER